MNLVGFIIGTFAVWRLSHALVKENGPRMWFARLRARFARTQKRSGGLFDAFSCVYCLSFWIGFIASLWASEDAFHWFGYGLAFSGGAFILELLANYLNSLTVVTPPTTHHQVGIARSAPAKQGDDVIGHPNTPNRTVTVEAKTVL